MENLDDGKEDDLVLEGGLYLSVVSLDDGEEKYEELEEPE